MFRDIGIVHNPSADNDSDAAQDKNDQEPDNGVDHVEVDDIDRPTTDIKSHCKPSHLKAGEYQLNGDENQPKAYDDNTMTKHDLFVLISSLIS